MTVERVEALISELTLDEKASLTAGYDFWSTVAIERVGIPRVRVTDGPNGARGSSLLGYGTAAAVCAPCGSALGATWDPALVERVGQMLGEEALTKACRVLLAPTVNIHRSPLAGRNFECYSEDPMLSGRIAAAFVRGVQSRDVATTVKHFAGNDAEFERNTINSVIDERALREIYLVPFELAVRDGGALGVMTAYNRLNGPFCSEHEELISTVLRGEWGFDGFVLTDWFANGSTEGAARAGTDLEMPGPARFFGTALAEAVRAGRVEEATVDEQVRRLLGVFERVGALDDDQGAEEQSIDRPDHRALAREAASGAMVLLRNDGVLPFPTTLRRIAVIGPNADRAQIMGGGSARLRPHHRTSPLDALKARFGDGVELRFERGCDYDKTAPAIGGPRLVAPDGRPGFAVELFAGHDRAGDTVHQASREDGHLIFFGQPGPGVPEDAFSLRAVARFTPAESGRHTFTLVEAGRARLLVDGAVAIDGTTDPQPPRGDELFGLGSIELAATLELTAERPVELVVEYSSRDAIAIYGVKVGWRPPAIPDAMERAVAAATEADAVIVVVGTNDDWESEGFDRSSMDLPGAQDDLVTRVLAANPNTVVVVNSGSPVTMDWADAAPAVLQVWFGGQEMAEALVDVLTGAAEPAGRLPTTFPIRVEHNPSFGNFPGEHGEVRYGEGVLVGYRWYDARHLPTRVCFGHGLSYSTFTIGDPVASSREFTPGTEITVAIPVTNTGTRRGAEVVQCYIAPAAARVTRPPQELKAFAKVWLEPDDTETVTLTLDDRSFAYWDPTAHAWRVDPGEFTLRVGRSSGDVAHTIDVTVAAGGLVPVLPSG
ncbi:MAG: glycoside hydrolase family 3 C-terminal domain-containing protein [Acidimicrobiia bacterium]|nr:glycoside hydrolase family 3 C-terminal domain-containing protein [Acidimicrobiia bacterium]